MGGGLSKKQKAARPQPQAPCAPPPQAPHGGRFDDSDGWEREGEDGEYFRLYSEKIAYPLAINIVFYVLTH